MGRHSDIFQFKTDLLTGQLHVSNNECRALGLAYSTGPPRATRPA
jgi:hypothetical protein